eukprot:CAMPEP_0185614596 /NCGR_PEP_ID=MMETSP0436-20130131/32332_1 /TAXON_ID=626734 ORGANISM="Favella taraikaensis, Strain Fe Narragansett Bay" /NCGR_SAMPLE_ID=MMETSP0436 /ASSEMBLY_ACC=CAM_ASM_000390 /LENGTH=91 /DNA_ID=CAMNT_0028249569 /DNA_START=69 /DNA_END=340 /DNA_ORIENTATION=-
MALSLAAERPHVAGAAAVGAASLAGVSELAHALLLLAAVVTVGVGEGMVTVVAISASNVAAIVAWSSINDSRVCLVALGRAGLETFAGGLA